MRKIYSSMNGPLCHHYRNALQSRGIEAIVQGEERRTAMGDLPIDECWIELWVEDDSRAEEAHTFIKECEPGDAPDWNCANCGEQIESQFDTCWKCGTTIKAAATE